MQNIAEFRIIGRVGKVTLKENVAFVSVGSNYNRKVNDEWKTDTYWNDVTFFGKGVERAAKFNKGDLIHVKGRMRKNSYESNGSTHYSTDVVAESVGIIVRKSDLPAQEADDEMEI